MKIPKYTLKMCAYKYTRAPTHIYIHTYIHTYIYIYAYIYIHIYIRSNFHKIGFPFEFLDQFCIWDRTGLTPLRFRGMAEKNRAEGDLAAGSMDLAPLRWCVFRKTGESCPHEGFTVTYSL